MDAASYKRDIDAAFSAYQDSNTSGQAYRQDGQVPYANHAIWAASTILLDTRLPKDVRELGYVVLLYHDVIEDTSDSLPTWISDEARRCVHEMTFQNFRASIPLLPAKEPKVKLFILVDKLSTLIEEHIPDETDKRKLWKNTVLYLAEEVEKHFGKTRIVAMAYAMAHETRW